MRTLFRHVRIFDGTATPARLGEVLVEGEKIARVAYAPDVIDATGACVINGHGVTLMPGMVEAHAHLTWASSVEKIYHQFILPPEELALYGTARSLAGWHARHRFCARCGSPTVLARGGWQLNCLNEMCRAEHYPRTDPVVIMTVEHEGRLLLGRQPRFPQGRYSALAGFVEPGEAIEEAVAREVWEEAGVRVEAVRYVASQPWPFPASLMIGCHAMATSPELTIDATELDDARWFSRAEVAEAMAAAERGEEGRAFVAPPRHAVAWHLLRHWLDGAGDQARS